MADILIIDDDILVCRFLSEKLRRLDHQPSYVHTLTDGLAEVSRGAFDIVFLDVNLPDGNGLDILPRLREASSQPEVIIITGHGEPDGAELAIRSNAWDYVQKDSSFNTIQLSLKRAIQFREQKFARSQGASLDRSAIVGNSNVILGCIEKIAKAVPNDNPVLITGETGTGKELFARSIHLNSRRSKNNFVVIDCAALPETLVESIVFGHRKGAFTNADYSQVGLVTQADKGTLFLDEVGELPMSIQKKFLRVLQEKQYRPVGEKQEINSDFRLICATNRDLSVMVEQGEFREDLYFRILSLTITVPPLRERKDDIPLLAKHYIESHCKNPGQQVHSVSSEFVEALQTCDWPGNVRQLFHAISYAHTEAMEEAVLLSRHLPMAIRAEILRKKFQVPEPARQEASPESSSMSRNRLITMKDYIEMTKQQYLKDLMDLTGRNIEKACRISGLSRGHLYQLLKKYAIE